jgi:hypothetical protein
MNTLRFAVSTIFGPIRVRVSSQFIIAASELIIAVSAVEKESKVSSGFDILETSFGGGEMAGERTGMVSAKCSDCE